MYRSGQYYVIFSPHQPPVTCKLHLSMFEKWGYRRTLVRKMTITIWSLQPSAFVLWMYFPWSTHFPTPGSFWVYDLQHFPYTWKDLSSQDNLVLIACSLIHVQHLYVNCAYLGLQIYTGTIEKLKNPPQTMTRVALTNWLCLLDEKMQPAR